MAETRTMKNFRMISSVFCGTRLPVWATSWVPLGVLMVLLFAAQAAEAQSVSISQKSGGTVRGEITDMTPDTIVVKTERETTTVDMTNVRNMTYTQAPVELTRAMNRFAAERYDEGLEELAKADSVRGGMEHEIAWQRALGAAESALHGGAVTPNDAGTTVSAFLAKYPKSFYTWPMRERLGRLLSVIGRPDLAQAEYAKLAEAASDEYRMKGSFYVGLSQLASGDGEGAGKSMAAVLAANVTGDDAEQIKSRAMALQARAIALTGDTQSARQMAEKLVAEQNPDNSALFAEIYNTIGYCHFQEGNLKAAVLAYLHTDLLFFNQPEAHAEALWYLSQIWPKLDKQDQGWEAQETLKRLYRNSVWAAKLQQ